MTYPVRIDRKVWVPMDDGTRIALTLYLPDAAGEERSESPGVPAHELVV